MLAETCRNRQTKENAPEAVPGISIASSSKAKHEGVKKDLDLKGILALCTTFPCCCTQPPLSSTCGATIALGPAEESDNWKVQKFEPSVGFSTKHPSSSTPSSSVQHSSIITLSAAVSEYVEPLNIFAGPHQKLRCRTVLHLPAD
jgi:hypothetical protein